MIIGTFDPVSGRPFVEGLLLIPELDVNGPVSFLVDTGSDSTCLMPADGVRLGIDYNNLSGSQVESYGVGGRATTYVFRALVVFVEDNALLRAYVIDLLIYPQRPQLESLDSLLGRDIINRWYMAYDHSSQQLEFTVRSADRTIR